MKFTGGYWQMRPGVTACFPAHSYEVEVEPGAMTVYGSSQPWQMLLVGIEAVAGVDNGAPSPAPQGTLEG